jgi:hypothetical protein
VAKLVNPQPTVSVSSSSVLICAGQSATLSASGASTYSWNPSNTGATIVITPTITSSYTVTGTSTVTGCRNSATITQSVNICTGIEEFNSNNYQSNIFPNPANEFFNLDIGANEILRVYNSLGQEIFKGIVDQVNFSIDCSVWANGLYFVEAKKLRTKIVVAH